MCHGLKITLTGREGSACTVLSHWDLSCQYAVIASLQEWIPLCFCTWRIKRFLFSIWFSLAMKQRSEAAALRHIPPESHIPARRAGQHRGMWSVDSEQKEALLHRLGSEISLWLGHELEAKAQPHFTWPPSPTAMMATVAGTNCYCGAGTWLCVWFF